MLNWVREEIELAKSDDSEYFNLCLDAAYEVMKLLFNQDHSGSSIHTVKHLVNRLIDGKPLTQIVDDEDVWYKVDDGMYQCKRMSSLFKYVDKDSSTIYSDMSRAVAKNVSSGSSWSSGFTTCICDEMFPIKMPYMPSQKNYVFLVDQFLSEEANGDYDHQHVVGVRTPTGEVLPINRYFKEAKENEESIKGWVEISKETYEEALAKVDI